MTASSVEEKRTWCGICEAACGLIATIESGRLTAVRPDPDHPASQGFACAKGLAWPAVLSDPDRVTSPLRRTKGGTFEEVTWEAALGEIGRRLRAQVKEYGTESIGLIEGNPVAANYSAFQTLMGMASALKTKHFYTTGSVDINNYFVVNQLLYGHTLTTPIPDFERADFALIVGANPLVSHGSMGTLGRVQDHLWDLVQRGGRLVVVDPRRTETADLGLHLPIRPGGDPWLLAAMLKVILRDGLVDEEFVRRNTTGFESLHHLVAQVDLDRAAAECGIPRDQIEELATDLASARSAVVYGRCGASLGQSSTLTKFLLDSVAIVTGNLDRAGAMVFSQPYFDAEKLTKLMGLNGVGRWHTRVDQFPEVLETAPMVSLAREIMTPGKGQMRAAIAVSSNFVMTSPGMLTEAVRSLDLFVSIDPYVNDSNQWADFILPPTLLFERDGFPLFSQLHAIRPNVQWADAVVAPPPNTRPDWWILDQICRELGLVPSPAPGAQLLGRLGIRPNPTLVCDLVLRVGPQGDWFGLRRSGVSRKKLVRDGRARLYAEMPAVGVLRRRIHTKDRKVHLEHDLITQEMQRLVNRISSGSVEETRTLRLFTVRELRSQNSWLHNVPKLVAGGRTCRLLIHPNDAADRGIAQGEQVAVSSEWGSITATASVTTEVIRGSVGMPAHWGHSRGSGWQRARDLGGSRYNDLVPDDAALVDQASGNAWLNGIEVFVDSLQGRPSGAPTSRTGASA